VPAQRRSARFYAVVLCAAAGVEPAGGQEAEPFRVRNLSPLVAIFGLPSWLGGPGGTATELAVTTEIANHYRLSARGSETLILDGETWRMNLAMQRAVGEDWSLGLEVPYVRHSGGALDDLIDGWHSFTGLPDGGRNNRTEDALLYWLEDAGGLRLSVDQRSAGIGDLQLSAGRAFGDRPLHFRATLKLPTGDERYLAGSGSTDLAVTVLSELPKTFRDRPAAFYWGVGLLWLGEAELLADRQEEVVYIAVAGVGWRPWPRIGLKVQLDGHTPFYDSALEEIGQSALQATVGGWWKMSERAVLDLAVNEDLHVSTSPDVVLHVAVRWAL
jgi:hypothetical protein